MKRGKTLLALFWEFFQFGCFTFGGGWSIVAQMQRLYVEKRKTITGEELLDIFMVAKYLERIGDHATNLAEWVEYAQTGARSKNGHWVSPEAQATGWI